MVIQPKRQPINLMLRFLGGVVLVLSFTLLIFFFIMRPPMGEFANMTLFLSITALISLLAGYSAYRFGWLNRSPRLRWTLISGYVLSTALTFVNVWVTARLMFINKHDLTLATILLVFAAGIAIALGFFLSHTVTDNIDALNRGASAIASGQLDTRVAVIGNDEMAELARAFNKMASQLEAVERKQRELDTLRRNLIAWAGHDLRTPLASVRAIVEALADGVVEDEATRTRYLRTAQRDIGALALLIDDLFEMAQIDAGGLTLDIQSYAMTDLISDTLESFSGMAAEKEITLDGAVQPGVDPVQCDARQISRVLTNLVGNALRHTPAGGRVFVRALPAEANVLVEVRDSGEGIPAEDLPHIFEQFYRAEKSRSRAGGGAGLGLAIAKGLVEAHGGEVHIRSVVGRGTSVAFSLPRVHDT
jgi:signal transduction histidine kinase